MKNIYYKKHTFADLTRLVTLAGFQIGPCARKAVQHCCRHETKSKFRYITLSNRIIRF